MTMKIPLTQGLHAVVDDDDYSALAKYKWHIKWQKGAPLPTRSVWRGREYIGGKFKKKCDTVTMKRQIMNPPPGMMVINLNHDTLDCQRGNLRICTVSEVRIHSRMKRGVSGYRGVRRSKSGAWEASYFKNYKKVYLGIFDTRDAAAAAYNEAMNSIAPEIVQKNNVDERVAKSCPVCGTATTNDGYCNRCREQLTRLKNYPSYSGMGLNEIADITIMQTKLAADGVRWCPECRETKPISEFHHVDGFVRIKCRSCHNKMVYRSKQRSREARP